MPNKAPNFKIPSTNSKLLELKKIKSKYKVLYFYPKDNTPGCTVETKDFNSLLSQFKKLDCEVIGRSTFLLKDDKIIKEWRSVKVKDHAKEVLEFLKTV